MYQSLLYQAEEGTKKDGLDKGPRMNYSRPNRRKWKLQPRTTCNKSGCKASPKVSKRSSCHVIEPSPKHKKIKLGSPIKSATKQKQESSSAAKLKLTWEPLAVEEMEMAVPSLEEISAEADCQPRRKPWGSLVGTFGVWGIPERF